MGLGSRQQSRRPGRPAGGSAHAPGHRQHPGGHERPADHPRVGVGDAVQVHGHHGSHLDHHAAVGQLEPRCRRSGHGQGHRVGRGRCRRRCRGLPGRRRHLPSRRRLQLVQLHRCRLGYRPGSDPGSGDGRLRQHPGADEARCHHDLPLLPVRCAPAQGRHRRRHSGHHRRHALHRRRRRIHHGYPVLQGRREHRHPHGHALLVIRRGAGDSDLHQRIHDGVAERQLRDLGAGRRR